MRVPAQTPEQPPWHADILSLKIEMMKMLGGAFVAFAAVLGLVGFFGFQQVMKTQLEKWAQDEFKVKIQASIALADAAAKQANSSLGEVNLILAGLKAKAVVPIGTIVPWFPPKGPIEVPQGWVLCDGNNGSPDLRDRFVLGTADAAKVGTPGGAKEHIHEARFKGTRFEAANVGRNGTGATRHDDNKIVVAAEEAMPPYVALVYIMKLP